MVLRLCIASFAVLAALAEQCANDSNRGIAVSRGHIECPTGVSMLQKATEKTNRLDMEQSHSSRQPALLGKEGPAAASTSEAQPVAGEEGLWVYWHDARLFWKAMPLLVLVLVLLLLFCVIAVTKEKTRDVEYDTRWEQEAWRREIDEREARRRGSPPPRKMDPRSELRFDEPHTMAPSWGEPRALPPLSSWEPTDGESRRSPVSVGELHGMLPVRGGLQSMPLRSMPLPEGGFSSGWTTSPHIAYGRGPPLPPVSGALASWQPSVRIPTTRATSADGRFMPSMHPTSSWVPSATAAAAVDSTGDGRANYIYAGADRNHDGIPDALQAPHASGRLSHIPPTGVRSLSAGFAADARYGLPNLPPLRDGRPHDPYSLPVGRALQPGITPWQTIGAMPVGGMLQSQPTAMAAVDANGDGRANYLYAGVDRNHDGIPDALQVPQARRAAIPATALPTHLNTSGLLWPGERPGARPQPGMSMLPNSLPMVQPDVATLPRAILQPGAATSPRTLPMHLPTNGLIWSGAPPSASERRGALEASRLDRTLYNSEATQKRIA